MYIGTKLMATSTVKTNNHLTITVERRNRDKNVFRFQTKNNVQNPNALLGFQIVRKPNIFVRISDTKLDRLIYIFFLYIS